MAKVATIFGGLRMWGRRVRRTPLEQLEAEMLLLQNAVDASEKQKSFHLCAKLCEHTRGVYDTYHNLVWVDPRLAKSKEISVGKQFDLALERIHGINNSGIITKEEQPHVLGMISNMACRIESLKVLSLPISPIERIQKLRAIGDEMVSKQRAIRKEPTGELISR